MSKREIFTFVLALIASASGFGQIHITTVDELQAIESDNSYMLDADLDLSELTTNLGDLTNVVFNGNFHTLSNLLYDGGEDGGGLFGNLTGCTISNLKISNFLIAGSWAGAIARHAETSSFYRCSSENGDIQASGIGGGIVGHAATTTVSECFVTGNVSGNDHVGGLIGHMDGECSISDSYVIGEISTANWQVGGIAGWGESAGNEITRCFAAGTVSAGQGFTGGIVGASSGGSPENVTISYCIALQSNLTANSDIIKTNRIIGDDGSATFYYNYGLATMTWEDPNRTDAWGSDLNGKDGEDITMEQVLDPDFYAENLEDWDFTDVWALGDEYPRLVMETMTPLTTGLSSGLPEKVQVTTVDGKIRVAAPVNSRISIYNTAGQLLADKLSGSSLETFTASKGILIVKVENGKTKAVYKIAN